MNSINDYVDLHLLGHGAQATVFSACDCTSKENVAIKVYSTSNLSLCLQEIRILQRIQKLNLKHSIHLKTSFLEADKIFIVMERAEGKELHDYLISNLFLEKDLKRKREIIKKIFKVLLVAVSELHENDVCHLDLKLDNIFYTKKNNQIKLIDFGFAQITKEKNEERLIEKYCGSIHYAAPEIIRNIPFDGKKADIWALGIILFTMIEENFPFCGHENSDSNSVATQILTEKICYSACFSKEDENFIDLMTNQNPNKRPSLKKLLNNPWFV